MKRARFALEVAHQKRKVLNDFEKEKEKKQLQAAIENAISQDLISKADLMMLEAELKRSGGPKPELSRSQRRALKLREHAFKLDETVRGKLAQIDKDGKTGAQLEKEIADSTDELEAVIDRAESIRTPAGWVRSAQRRDRAGVASVAAFTLYHCASCGVTLGPGEIQGRCGI